MPKRITPSKNKVACIYAKRLSENNYDRWHSAENIDIVRIFYDRLWIGRNRSIPLEEAKAERVYRVFERIKEQWEKIQEPEKSQLERIVEKFFERDILNESEIPGEYRTQTLELYNRLKALNEKGHIYPIPKLIQHSYRQLTLPFPR